MRSVIGVEVGGADDVDSSGWAVRLSRESVRVMLAVWDRPMDVAGKSRLADMSVNGLSAWKGGIEVSSSSGTLIGLTPRTATTGGLESLL